MGVCFKSSGIILLKNDYKDSFIKGFLDIAVPFDDNIHYMSNDDGLFQFFNYARHYFMSEIIEYIRENIVMVDSCQIWFECDDEDDNSSDGSGFPFIVFVEVCNGKLYEECLSRRLPCEWVYHVGDMEWFSNEREKENERLLKKFDDMHNDDNNDVIHYKKDDNDLPF